MKHPSPDTRIPSPSPRLRRLGRPRLLYTIENAAFLLGIGRSSVYKAINMGELESVHVGRSVRIPADALVAFVETLRAQA